MSALTWDSGLVMLSVYEATWPSATKLWGFGEQRINSRFGRLEDKHCFPIALAISYHPLLMVIWQLTNKVLTISRSNGPRYIKTKNSANFDEMEMILFLVELSPNGLDTCHPLLSNILSTTSKVKANPKVPVWYQNKDTTKITKKNLISKTFLISEQRYNKEGMRFPLLSNLCREK